MNLRLAVYSPRLFVCLLAIAGGLSATEVKPDEPDKAEKPAADSMLGKEPGQVRDDNGLKMKLVWCPPGVVAMKNIEFRKQVVGEIIIAANDDSLDAKPQSPLSTATEVRVKAFANGCWMGKYEVTRLEWKQIMDSEPWKDRDFRNEGADFPVTFVSWDDAIAFCQKLTQQERKAGRLPADWEFSLPTDAQWERACRARSETVFSFGNDESKMGEYAWFVENTRVVGEQFAHRVGQKKPNAWGLHDMHGNVWEWCRDIYVKRVPGGRDAEVTKGSSERVQRGGSWNDSPTGCQSSHRIGDAAGKRYVNLGFRVALSETRSTRPPDAEDNPRSGNK